VNEFFSIYLILPAALDPGVYSVSNRDEYQKHTNNVSGSSGQRSRIRVSALPDFLSSGSGTGSNQPREYN
jgi:hypothetical protein